MGKELKFFLNRNILLFSFLIFLRFIALELIPIFGDEGLYLRLGQEFVLDPSSFLNSLQFGVMPMVVIVAGVIDLLALVTNSNPLFLMRSVTVIFDLLTVWLLYQIGSKLFDKKVGLIGAIIYLLLPMTFFHSRLVLLESLTNFFAVGAIYFGVTLFFGPHPFSKSQFKIIVLSGLFFLASYFTKPLALVYFPALVSLPVLAHFTQKPNNRNLKGLVIKTAMLLSIIGIALVILYLPIASEFNRHVATNNASFDSLITNFKQNLWRLYWWSKVYFTVPILLLVLGGLIMGTIKKQLSIIWLFVWMGVVISMDTFFSAHFYPRHLYPLSLPIALISAYFLIEVSKKNQFLFRILFFITLLPSCLFITNLIQSPLKTPIALEDRQQFYEDWTAGIGFKEIAQKLNSESTNKKIVVFIDDHVNEKYVFTKIYRLKNAEVVTSSSLQNRQFIESDLLNKYSDQEKFIVLNRFPEADLNWPVTEYFSYPKGSNRFIKLYKLK